MKTIVAVVFVVFALSCQSSSKTDKTEKVREPATINQSEKLDTATFAGGCFWCIEAAFEQIEGVVEAVSGYAGGDKANADYRAVSSGRTKHAEAVQVYYDPSVIDFNTLLEILFTAHDPTQLNRQGPDVGPQYRSAVFYHNEKQKVATLAKMDELQPSFQSKIVTEVSPLQVFYLAEDYHQDYEKKNPYQPYILSVSKPKINKVKEKFKDRLKDED